MSRVHLYALSWNEMRMLGFFFRHYDPIVERYVIYDDGSDDGTLDVLRAHPRVEIRRFDHGAFDSVVSAAQVLFDAAWQESRGVADWAIVTDIDEHLDHPDLSGYLDRQRAAGVTVIPGLGFQMVTTEFPSAGERLATTRRRGTPDEMMCKVSILDPNALTEINYSPGRHVASPKGRVVFPERDEILMLHYKYLGVDYVLERHAFLGRGLGAGDRAKGWGGHYHWKRDKVARVYADLEARSVDLSQPVDFALLHPKRWWRPLPPA